MANSGVTTTPGHDPALDANSIELRSFTPSALPTMSALEREHSVSNPRPGTMNRTDADLLRLATRLWPRSVFESAKSVQSDTKSTVKSSACSHTHHSHGTPAHVPVAVSPQSKTDSKHVSPLQKKILQPAKDLGTAAFYTATSNIGVPSPLSELSGRVSDTASAALGALGQIIDKNGLSTQGTTPFRKPRRSVEFVDPTMIAVPLYPRPSSLNIDVPPGPPALSGTMSRHEAWDNASCPTGLGITSLPAESTFLSQHSVQATGLNTEACSSVVQSLKDTQETLISEWRRGGQSNAYMSEMFAKFGILPRTCPGVSLKKGESRSSIEGTSH